MMPSALQPLTFVPIDSCHPLLPSVSRYLSFVEDRVFLHMHATVLAPPPLLHVVNTDAIDRALHDNYSTVVNMDC